MTPSDIARLRLRNQHISEPRFERPADVVRWLGAVQSQEYQGAKWALGLRSHGVTDAAIDAALAEGSIIRTHVMRPTWHFVTPADIRWMLALTGKRIIAGMASRHRELELDEATFRKSETVFEKALQGGKQLTRQELGAALEQSGIVTAGQRLPHILMYAELVGLTCSGGLHGKQHTYALLDERVPETGAMQRDEAVAALASRYFTSHGPATERDFAWWSGLTLSDARAGIGAIKSELAHEVVDGKSYWLPASAPLAEAGKSASIHLLPSFDEYFVGYTDRSASFDTAHTGKLDSRGSILNQYSIVIDGQAVGTWKRTFKKNAVVIEATPFTPLSKARARAFASAAKRYGEFLEMPVTLAQA